MKQTYLHYVVMAGVVLGLITLSTNVYAQYTGGNEDGYDVATSITTLSGCTSTSSVTSDIYKGGNEDGYDLASAITTLSGCVNSSSVTSTIYAGGNEDGYDYAGAITTLSGCVNSSSVTSTIYTGGNEDGYDYAGSITTLSGCVNSSSVTSAIYTGGNEDGYDYGTAITTLSGCVSTSSVTSAIYAGSNEDGYDLNFLTANLSPAVSISANDSSVCTADTVTVTASPVAAGATPVYSWYKNGVLLSESSGILKLTSLRNNDSLYVSMVTSLSCANNTAPVRSQKIVFTIDTTRIYNNTIVDPGLFCQGNDFLNIRGTLPTSSSGVLSYSWVQSPDATSWSSISGAVSSTYQIPAASANYYFKRLVSNSNCNTPSYSNSVHATVAPAPTQLFSSSVQTGACTVMFSDGWVDIPSAGDPSKLIVSLSTYIASTDLNVANVIGYMHDTLITLYRGLPTMRRHVDVMPDSNRAARVKLYFSQADFDSLQAVDSTIHSYRDLQVSKFQTGTRRSGMIIVPDSIVANTPFTGTYTMYLTTPGFSSFYVHSANNSSVLPIALSHFDISCNQHQKMAFWSTETEVNNDHFELQGSNDCHDWTNISISKGQQLSTQHIDYSEDISNSTAFDYYRLKQVDLDGKFFYSSKVYNPCNVEKTFHCQVTPNPASQQASLRIQSSNMLGLVHISLYDDKGQQVWNKSAEGSGNDMKLELDLSLLASGAYQIKVRSGQLEQSLSLTIIK